MMYQFEKHFTRAEANALIPNIRQLFTEVHQLLGMTGPAPDAEPDTTRPNGNGNGHHYANGNGNGHGHNAPAAAPDPARYEDWEPTRRKDAAQKLLRGLHQAGIVIQDIQRGLIDFPAIMDDREIFLCYELADGLQIQFYHDLTAGYAGRTPLPESPND